MDGEILKENVSFCEQKKNNAMAKEMRAFWTDSSLAQFEKNF